MIFVTVGTHEQPFDRLVEYMDKWAYYNKESVVIQTGYSSLEPVNCQWSKLYPYEKMVELVNNARIVISHGGPSSFIMPLQMGKIPIVVPRKREFKEHVNDHQATFSRIVAKRYCNIIVIEEIEELSDVLDNYESIVKSMNHGHTNNNKSFCYKFEKIVDELIP